MSPAPCPRVVALDGDDTLWENETNFVTSYARFRELLLRHVDMPPAEVDRLLLATEKRNLKAYGYGVKGFVLSMLETAIDVTDARIPASDLKEILGLGRWMLEHPLTPIDGAAEVVTALRDAGHEVWLITKGDLFDQESKVARSGLAELFHRVEIVSEKDPATYRRLLERHGVEPADFAMAGNAMRSDVLPVLAIGARAFFIPHPLTWAHEVVQPHPGAAFVELKSLRDLPAALRAMAA